ncbi:MAG: ABC transporter ATP-binding protein [Anaerolineales bacterium]|nr:ABC transporter ATP-binding protein [Anaerolineales bacterium]
MTPSSATSAPSVAPVDLIEMRGITKVFPPDVVALDDVSVSFRQGEIHAIVGENGAGKSTLMKVLYGQERATRGAIFLDGRPVHFREPGEAIARGLGMVHQEILLIPEYTVWENVVLGVEPVTRFGRLDAATARARVQAKITEFGLALDPDARVGDLSVAARQKVEILKLLYRAVSVLILDEPTAVLTPQEIPQLFDELRRLRAGGKTILFISHHLDEVLALSDRITVLRKGRKVATVGADSLSKTHLAQLMIGREVAFTRRRSPSAPGPVIASLHNLAYVDEDGRERLKAFSLEVHAGEIVGVAGVEGNGQLELVNVLTGLWPASSGRFLVNGHDLTRADILERRRHMAYVPQDRRTQGASISAPILENAIMTHHRLTPALTQWGGLLINYNRARAWTHALRDRFAVTMASAEAPFRSLSGGNQQKVILGRELLLDRPFLLLDQPTRGLDVGSMEYVHAQILAARDEGRAILLLSADLEELFSLADRLAVMHRGALVAVKPTEQTTVDEVGYWMLQGRTEPC